MTEGAHLQELGDPVQHQGREGAGFTRAAKPGADLHYHADTPKGNQAAEHTAVQPTEYLVTLSNLSRAGHQYLHPSDQKLLSSPYQFTGWATIPSNTESHIYAPNYVVCSGDQKTFVQIHSKHEFRGIPER